MKLNGVVVEHWAVSRTLCAVNSSDPCILNINVLVFPVTFTEAFAFVSLLCTLVFFPFHIMDDQDYYFQYGFQPFLRVVLWTLKKISLSLSCLIPTFTSAPLCTQLIGESRTENSWSPNIAGIQQAQEKHLTRLSLLSLIKMAGHLAKLCSAVQQCTADSSAESARVVPGKC